MGTGNCEYEAPHVFEVGDEGTAGVIGPVNADDQKVRAAVDACPVGALKLLSGEG